MTPGAVIGVLLWLVASWGFSTYISNVTDVGAIYGAFTGAILLVAWLWLTNVALLFGAELNAEIERQRELRDGVPTATRSTGRPARASRGRARGSAAVTSSARSTLPMWAAGLIVSSRAEGIASASARWCSGGAAWSSAALTTSVGAAIDGSASRRSMRSITPQHAA